MNINDLLETNKINQTTDNKSIPDELLFEPKTSIDTRTTTLYINSKERNKSFIRSSINTNNSQLLFIEEYIFIILKFSNSEYIQTPLQVIFTGISNNISNYLCIDENEILFNNITE